LPTGVIAKSLFISVKNIPDKFDILLLDILQYLLIGIFYADYFLSDLVYTFITHLAAIKKALIQSVEKAPPFE